MDRRKLSILKRLRGLDISISGNQLAKELNVSSRTIRNDIKTINLFLEYDEVNACIKATRGKGYRLYTEDASAVEKFIKKASD
ncbi:helix-turn-helix domain-containing protein [Virgibacillus halophilus]|uniref:Helix-turn-helix domain-containing protein n=1 Tax=Tigheibacillus halophilus TaxID=361280 RepID=A0ABU5C375_9BACI|nr:helix-turn-helix domain-containing protein [Virgibacillus halophilus]